MCVCLDCMNDKPPRSMPFCMHEEHKNPFWFFADYLETAVHQFWYQEHDGQDYANRDRVFQDGWVVQSAHPGWDASI